MMWGRVGVLSLKVIPLSKWMELHMLSIICDFACELTTCIWTYSFCWRACQAVVERYFQRDIGHLVRVSFFITMMNVCAFSQRKLCIPLCHCEFIGFSGLHPYESLTQGANYRGSQEELGCVKWGYYWCMTGSWWWSRNYYAHVYVRTGCLVSSLLCFWFNIYTFVHL